MDTKGNNILAVGYVLIWVITFIWYHYRKRNVDAGSLGIGCYTIYAFFSVVTLNDQFFLGEYENLTLFPFIYLFTLTMIALSPAICHHFNPPKKIENLHSKVLYIPCIILIVSIFFMLPDVISNLDDALQIITDISAGEDAYLENSAEKGKSGIAIRNLPAVMFNLCFDISTFLFFYFSTRKKENRSFLIVLFISLFIGMVIPIIRGQRGSVVNGTLTIFMAYLLFRRYLSKRFNRIAMTTGVILIIIITIPIASITVSRFGDRKGSEGASTFVYYYLGQANLYFNSYAMDPGGIRHGDRTINLVKRAIWPDTPRNYQERRMKYRHLKIDDLRFVTFVGDFVIDFGPIVAFIIFVVFNIWVLRRIRPRDNILKLRHLLLIYFTLCICIQGGTLFSYADTGNLIVLMFFIFYICLKFANSEQESSFLGSPLMRK